MKKIVSLMLALVLVLLTACSVEQPKAADFEIASLKGPTSMGLVNLMDRSEKGDFQNKYNVTVYGTADEFVSRFSGGEISVANIPSNLSSILYNRTEGKIRVIAVNTLGVLYVIAKGDVESVEDLRGKTIYTTGKGTTPEHVINYVLKQNGIDPVSDVNIEYLSEATEVAAKLSEGAINAVALLPQPYVTVVTGQNKEYTIALDMNEEWERVSGGTPIVTGVVAVHADFYERNKDAFEGFLKDYAESVKYTNENPAEASQLIEKYGIIKAAVAEKAIPYSNITLLTGEEMEKAVSAYLKVLFDFNPSSVGGAMPDEDYFIK